MNSSHHAAKHDGPHRSAANHTAGGHHYAKFALMVVLMFVAMYALMYAMVDRFDNVFNSLNQFYMAALMTAAMVLIELLVMAGMYPDKRLNLILLVVSAVVLVASWFAIREQAAIGDRQFLRSMIPHHAGAILICEEAPLDDARIRRLCEQIIRSQQEEIRAMKALL
jgi:heme/copper-type cytochrome/quinol oxidase subunit 4